jgi:molecular chaperone HtpG
LPNRFFEVILNGVQPIKNDILLNNELIENYISEVCPVPFKNSFKHRTEICNWLEDDIFHEYKIYLNSSDQHITRPYGNDFHLSKDKIDNIKQVELIELKTNQGDVLAKGFILHHSYLGAISDSKVSGLRVRSGNIQVGDNDVFRALFKQERFNTWCIGEFHILDSKIKANGRRDGFEHNKYFYNFLDYLKPEALKLSKIIEDSSRERNKEKSKNNIHKFVSKKDKAIKKIEDLINKHDISKSVSQKIINIINKEI